MISRPIITKSVLLSAALFSIGVQAQFKQTPLPYSYNAFPNVIDAETMETHYTKHAAGYVSKLNAAIANTPLEKQSMEAILANISSLSTEIRNNAGGHYNHELYWKMLNAGNPISMSENLKNEIIKEFGSIEGLKSKMAKASADQFGSGWVWLIVSPEKKLLVTSTPNQDNPLMDVVPVRGIPIIGIDVWEHAYYLKYKNKRADYFDAVFNILNWQEISSRFKDALGTNSEEWESLEKFHEVMAATFHPVEKGNYSPLKLRAGELAKRAKELQNSDIPSSQNKTKLKASIQKLIMQTDLLEKRVKAKAKDAELKSLITNTHNIFHEIMGLCKEK